MPMKANKTEPQSQTRKQKKDTPWILHIFNHICFVTTIIGCYSCHWKIKQEKKFKHGQCCSLRERLFYPCLVISFCMSVLLVFVWVESSNEYNGFDWVIFIGTGLWFFWSIVLLSFLGILAAYTSLLLVLGFLLLWEGIELYLHWCHKILILLVIVICSFFFWILFTYWKDRWLTVGLSLQVFAPYIHLSSIAMMVILSWPLAFYLIHLEGEARIRRYQMTCNERKRNKRCNVLTKLRALQVAIGLPFFLILLCLYLLPLGNFSACVQEKNKLAPKPYFFGHRGAPMLGPENTIMSFEKAVEHGAYGLESDVHISYDHVPFLMHDSDLRRTTNIKEVLPNASLTHPSLFDWDFLSTLNAGKWFSHAPIKPFFGMKPLSEADRERAGNQKIPKLTELLELAHKEKKFVIFDLYGPAPNHSLRALYVHHVVSTILDSQIEQRLIFWLPGFEREYVKKKAPGFQQVSRLHSVERLTKENITRINVDYKNLFYNGMRWKESKKEKLLKSTSIHTDIEETASNMEKGSLETLGLLPSSSQPRSKEPSATQAPSVSQQPPGRKLSHHQDPPKRNMLPGVAKNIRSPVSPKGNVKPPVSPKEKIKPPVSTKGDIKPPVPLKGEVKPPVHPKGVIKPPAPPKMEARPLASPKREVRAPVPLKAVPSPEGRFNRQRPTRGRS
ncbi:glycerophosphodiester phosphodiesterase domain-containing protein 4 isoform X5 [Bos taurus]|uniref:glycerophosphodiester phosphodiesterase domain-containing protein 4 isoform X5 n=1 Tax=Bos taurus TaxID=9913 RepID=UPI0028CB92F1|nr:glycerophosphodiester phosphodiesterase domain-containing protein 4 isoform X5 [Bos taurus]